MTVVYDRHGVRVLHADCLAALSEMADASADSVIVDPPYGLSENRPADVVTAITAWANGDRARVPSRKGGFMGQEWDSFVPPPAVWDECLRVLRPGGHLACFAGSRTLDLMTLSVRMAGFEIRDTIAAWVYSSGMVKSLDVSQAIDRAAGAERVASGPRTRPDGSLRRPDIGGAVGSCLAGSVDGTLNTNGAMAVGTVPATDSARTWEGWGTALAPAFEPIILARKPLSGTVAATVLEHGTGGLNIAATRTAGVPPSVPQGRFGGSNDNRSTAGRNGEMSAPDPGGRWPKNVVLAHHPLCSEESCADGCHVRELDEQTGTLTSGKMMPTRPAPSQRGTYGQDAAAGWTTMETYGDSGSASRFFPTFRYEAKAPASERPQVDGVAHPTVKPLALMRWLVRLLTPPGGLVLDCFAGSGSTGQAARAEGMRAVLVEREAAYIPLIKARLDARDRTPAKATGEVSGDEPMDLLDLLNEEAS